MQPGDDKLYRLLAGLPADELRNLMQSPEGFAAKLKEFPDDPVNLQPDSEEIAESATDFEVIMPAAARKWHQLSPPERDALLTLAGNSGADARDCRETLDLWEL